MRLLTSIVAVAGLAALAASEASDELTAAWRDELPEEMAEAAEDAATSGSSAAGRWFVATGEMDGSGSPEAILVVLPTGRPGQVRFFAEREGKSPEEKTVKLKGAPLVHASINFHEFTEGRALAHVDGGESGQAILGWNGKKLEEIWKIGKTRDDERHWFDVEDLNGDGVSEVVRFFRRELDVYTNEDDLGDEGGAADRRMGNATDAVAVYRWSDGKWKKDGALLESVK
jgi:hypothetical protein